MSGRPPPVRLDDLAEPRFSDEVLAIRAMMGEAAAGLEIAPEPLMAAAAEHTGLSDFGGEDFVERLDVLCSALRREAGLSPAGVAAQHSLLTGLLRNRLLVEDLLRRHPEILEVEIRAPIVICGLPRTGTTHLHNLLSADPSLRSLPYWESLEPVLPQSEIAGRAAGDPDPRLERTAQALWFVDAAMPHFRRMHDMTVDHAHEEIQLLAVDFSSMLFETIAPMPSWRDHYLSRDQRPSYRYLHRLMQVLQWLRGGERWVLKSPQHIEQFAALSETFPDATFVVTHRDPTPVMVSMVTMLTYSARMAKDSVDLVAMGAYWSDRLERMLRSCVEDRDRLPPERSVDVRFEELTAADMAVVERVYEVAGQPMSAEARQAMERFAADHPRGRHGGVVYEPAQFGIDIEERRRSLSFYSERFDTRLEEHP